MKAMILAAGLGTRLRPLTNDRPKALVEIGGHTLLEIALARLRMFGVREVIVNVHHFADMIVEYLHANGNFGMRIEISRELVLLDTGGGLKNASDFFLESAGGQDEPFILHNVDIVSTIDIGRMVRFHAAQGALATIAVQSRQTSRYLLFDENDQLCGRRSDHNGNLEMVRPALEVQALAYACIQVISPRLFAKLEEKGAFPIFDSYLRLAGKGEKFSAFRADECYWRDLGRQESIEQATRDMLDGKFSII
jgi:NDP-sugar pyrophosphorylase family protein